jgi:peptidoglycan hydrolase CwlO-like protein
MWNLSGDDIQKAKEELKGRRAAIQARYDTELKQLEREIADLEAFERAAVNMISHLKGEEAPPAVAEPAPPRAAEPVAAAESEAEPATAASEETPAEQGAAAEPAADARPAPGERGSSRWRMRLGTTEGAP